MATTRDSSLATRCFAILFGAFFVMAGLPKVAMLEGATAMFASWGFPIWFMIAVGATEILGGILLIVPRLRTYGAAILSLVMLGAIGTHVANGEFLASLVPLVLLLGLTTLVRKRIVRYPESEMSHRRPERHGLTDAGEPTYNVGA